MIKSEFRSSFGTLLDSIEVEYRDVFQLEEVNVTQQSSVSGSISHHIEPEVLPEATILELTRDPSGITYSTEYRLHQAEYILEQSLSNSVIAAELKKYGYSEEKLLEGKSLLNNAIIALENEISHDNYHESVSDDIRELLFKAQDRYQDHTKIGRVAFKSDPIALKKLGLADRPKRAMTGLIEQMHQFYRNVLDDDYYVGKLSEYGVNQDTLQETDKLVEELFNHSLSEDVAEIRQVIEACDKALDHLEDWLADFLVIAEVAFKKRPQILKQMGLQFSHPSL